MLRTRAALKATYDVILALGLFSILESTVHHIYVDYYDSMYIYIYPAFLKITRMAQNPHSPEQESPHVP